MQAVKVIFFLFVLPGVIIGGCIMYSGKVGVGRHTAPDIEAELETEAGYLRHRVTQSLGLIADVDGRIFIEGEVDNRGDRAIEIIVHVDFSGSKMKDKFVSTGRIPANKKKAVRKFVRNLPKRNGRVRSAYYRMGVSRLKFR